MRLTYLKERRKQQVSPPINARSAQQEPFKEKQAFKVLVVEDCPAIQMVLQAMLKSLHCEVDVVGCGTAAIEKVSEKYDLAFLDIGLPDMSGLEVCKIIRQQGFEKTKIAILTSHDSECRPLALAAGANYFYQKPLSFEDMTTLLRLCASEREAGDDL